MTFWNLFFNVFVEYKSAHLVVFVGTKFKKGEFYKCFSIRLQCSFTTFFDNDGGSVNFMFSKKATRIEKNLHHRFDT